MHQRLHRPRQKPVVDEEVFLDVQLRVASLEIAGAVALHPVAQRQVLRPRRRTNGVGLYNASF